jgi:hypothetical protein
MMLAFLIRKMTAREITQAPLSEHHWKPIPDHFMAFDQWKKYTEANDLVNIQQAYCRALAKNKPAKQEE